MAIILRNPFLEEAYKRAESMHDEALPRLKARAVLVYLSEMFNHGAAASHLRKTLSTFDLMPNEEELIWNRLQAAACPAQSTETMPSDLPAAHETDEPATETTPALDRQAIYDAWDKRHKRGDLTRLLERINVDDGDFRKWRRGAKFSDVSDVAKRIVEALLKDGPADT
jgi:hypothetical protein